MHMFIHLHAEIGLGGKNKLCEGEILFIIEWGGTAKNSNFPEDTCTGFWDLQLIKYFILIKQFWDFCGGTTTNLSAPPLPCIYTYMYMCVYVSIVTWSCQCWAQSAGHSIDNITVLSYFSAVEYDSTGIVLLSLYINQDQSRNDRCMTCDSVVE